MVRRLVILLWRALALACVALGLVGIVVPGLPTVPFLLVAAWAAGHGWPKLEAWLLAHTHFGPPIRRWREQGAIPRKAKSLAIVMMTASSIVLWHTALAVWIKVLVTVLMAAVAVWMWRRPEG
ncbi:MAG: hypothetical protein H6R07_1077 [Proteobacteria bacterium]|nr:hypothetical protein [Pseudomonadota bacterium]